MMKSIFIWPAIVVAAFLLGHYMGHMERIKDGQLLYYSTNMADVRGLLVGLDGEDISQAPKTQAKLLAALKQQNETLNLCLLDETCPGWIKGMVKDVYDRSMEKIGSPPSEAAP